MVTKAAVCLLLGVPILLAPVFAYSLFGVSLDAGGGVAAREYGASMIGNLLLTWFGRNAPESDLRRVIAAALCVYDAIGLVVAFVATITGVMGLLGWLIVAIYLFFTVGFGSFWLTAKRVTCTIPALTPYHAGERPSPLPLSQWERGRGYARVGEGTMAR